MMLPPMIFTNGRLIFPERIADGLSLRVEAGKIVALGREIPIAGEEVIDLAGNFLAPGFIDLHVHGAVGRDTMEGTADAFRAICDYHAGGGTTSLLLTTVSAPLEEIVHWPSLGTAGWHEGSGSEPVVVSLDATHASYAVTNAVWNLPAFDGPERCARLALLKSATPRHAAEKTTRIFRICPPSLRLS
jgi:hypothetical protein